MRSRPDDRRHRVHLPGLRLRVPSGDYTPETYVVQPAGHALQHRLAPRSGLSRSGALEQHRVGLSHRGRPDLDAAGAATRRRSGAAARPRPRSPHPAKRRRQAAASTPRPPSAAPAAARAIAAAPSGAAWVWPTEHAIAAAPRPRRRHFAARGLGQPVRAACSGRVVYVGSGIRGYGNLIIIKHGDSLLSAYAHTRELAVHEGQEVLAGQQIAQMGAGPHQIARALFRDSAERQAGRSAAVFSGRKVTNLVKYLSIKKLLLLINII